MKINAVGRIINCLRPQKLPPAKTETVYINPFRMLNSGVIDILCNVYLYKTSRCNKLDVIRDF